MLIKRLPKTNLDVWYQKLPEIYLLSSHKRFWNVFENSKSNRKKFNYFYQFLFKRSLRAISTKDWQVFKAKWYTPTAFLKSNKLQTVLRIAISRASTLQNYYLLIQSYTKPKQSWKKWSWEETITSYMTICGNSCAFQHK